MIRSTFNSWREYLTPAYHTSTFNTTGEITPQEFIEAGDYLVYKFPTWQWSSAPPNKRRGFLPEDKQYLITRKVPSFVRASDYLGETGENDDDEEDDVDEDGWTKASKPKLSTKKQKPQAVKSDDFEDIDELIDDNAEDNEDDDEEVEEKDPNKRSYDLFIHYSTAYRVPRMYLIGYDSNGSPLSPEEMFEDVSSDYRDKTVTIEKAPFMNDTTTVSIHPCRHAAVMKVLISRAIQAVTNKKKSNIETNLIANVKKLGLADNDEEDWEDVNALKESESEPQVVRVDQYLIIFLKFITSVTPGIEHDYTMDAF
ncbi:hypothetical protein WICMUC_003701 [Wickerhamomyces mucosus]|uniref:Autophagy-related protein 3 n=1 Tax=Wickerhamomyces mucosus TaxID=1378264 RepID=A0A9P8TCL1_9ASCO|nr:hypothetical protein WICMUC_003701 [Wickerhamomyces mucosus]